MKLNFTLCISLLSLMAWGQGAILINGTFNSRNGNNSYYIDQGRLNSFGGSFGMAKVWVKNNGIELLLGGSLQIEGATNTYDYYTYYSEHLAGKDKWTLVTVEALFLVYKEAAPRFGFSFGAAAGFGGGSVKEQFTRTYIDYDGTPYVDYYDYRTGFAVIPEFKILLGPYFDLSDQWRINAWLNAGFSGVFFTSGYFGEVEGYGLVGARVGAQYTFGK